MEAAELRESLVTEIAVGRLAWSEPRALARGLGATLAEVSDALAALSVEGWVDLWPLPWGEAVATLTPLAAERLGLVLEERGRDELPRWVLATPEAESRPVRIPEPDTTRAATRAALHRRPPFRCWFLQLDPEPVEVE